MRVGDKFKIDGMFTKEKYIVGRTLQEIERILGYHVGRFRLGIAVVALTQLPELDGFDLAGYSNIALHRRTTPTGLDLLKIKKIARASWSTIGFERLVKILPGIGHDDYMDSDLQYPAGLAAPQWIISKKAPRGATVVAVIKSYPNSRYVPVR